MESVVAGKARVHELAKELGVTSKEVLARLNDQGEFVKSASSTVEAPVARRLRASFGGAKAAAQKGQTPPPPRGLPPRRSRPKPTARGPSPPRQRLHPRRRPLPSPRLRRHQLPP